MTPVTVYRLLALCLAAFTLEAKAQNLSFESRGSDGIAGGWEIRGDVTEFNIDAEFAQQGQRSLKVVSSGTRRSPRFSTRMPASDLAGNRLRIGAYIRQHDDTTIPSLWVRISGQDSLLYIDSSDIDGSNIGSSKTSDARQNQWRYYTLDAPLSTLAERIEFGGLVRGKGAVWFDNFSIVALDVERLPSPASTATRFVNQALDIIEQNSVQRPVIDWVRLRTATLAQTRGAKTVEEAYLAIRFALGELNDRHSYFMTPQQMSRLDNGAVSNARTGRDKVAPAGLLTPGGFGYLHIPGFASGDQYAQVDFATEVQSLIETLAGNGACAWIVDFRGNSGGNLWPMLVGVGPLLTASEVGVAVYPDTTEKNYWYRDGKAGLGDYVQLRVHRPFVLQHPPSATAVLIDGSTASAAEILTTALKTQPNTRSFGAATRGAHTATRVFPLYDGAAIVLAVATTRDRLGQVVDGQIEPDEVIERRPRPLNAPDTSDQDPVISAATQWLSRQIECEN